MKAFIFVVKFLPPTLTSQFWDFIYLIFWCAIFVDYLDVRDFKGILVLLGMES